MLLLLFFLLFIIYFDYKMIQKINDIYSNVIKFNDTFSVASWLETANGEKINDLVLHQLTYTVFPQHWLASCVSCDLGIIGKALPEEFWNMVSGFFSLISNVTLSTSSELSNPCDTREMDHSISECLPVVSGNSLWTLLHGSLPRPFLSSVTSICPLRY